MLKDIKIRPEIEKDIDRIEHITLAAFENHPISNQTEHLIVADLRKKGALTLSLVAEMDGVVVGHIAFSGVTINGDNLSWFGIGPVSVVPEYQNQGIGSQLVKSGLETMKKLGAKGCALVGDPAYYSRFGFQSNKALFLEGVPPENFMVISFDGNIPSGKVEFHKAFIENS